MTTATLTAAQRADLIEIGKDLAACERALASGHTPAISTTPNGRDIRLAPGGFQVQPENDNYWLTVPTIDAAMDAFERPENYRD